jgi:hypothetical protein
VQYVPRLPQSNRTLVVPLLAAALGAGLATAAFALLNIEDGPNVSLPAVQSASPSTAQAGERSDGGPAEGTAQQIMSPAVELRGSTASATHEGSSPDVITDTVPPKGVAAATSAPRYDGGPDEGSSAGAMAQP